MQAAGEEQPSSSCPSLPGEHPEGLKVGWERGKEKDDKACKPSPILMPCFVRPNFAGSLNFFVPDLPPTCPWPPFRTTHIQGNLPAWTHRRGK